MTDREKILSRLDELNIKYELTEHKALFSMDEYDEAGINGNDEICKNLFLRDYKGNRHMLVVLRGSKSADLVLIRNEINSSRPSFASDERMKKHLNVTTGSVSPLGIINDVNDAVEVYFDRDLKDAVRLGFHPNDNTATVFMSFADINRYIESTGHRVSFINV
jgi:Ala-tRNA(Pro) deacylase